MDSVQPPNRLSICVKERVRVMGRAGLLELLAQLQLPPEY